MSTTQLVLIQAPNSLVFLNSAITPKYTTHPKIPLIFFQPQSNINCSEIAKLAFLKIQTNDHSTYRQQPGLAANKQLNNQQLS
jgi:hypothetical protein